jgi:DNA sulfur modification protein DndC
MDDNQVGDILKELCKEHDVPVELMREMLEEERNVRHLKRRRGITERLRTMVEKSIGVAE